MRARTIVSGAAALSLAASAAMAAGLTDRLQAERMTVVKLDRTAGQFLCAEHRKWTSVARDDLRGVSAGDVVRVEKSEGKPARLVRLRQAADELTSPEQ